MYFTLIEDESDPVDKAEEGIKNEGGSDENVLGETSKKLKGEAETAKKS